MPRKKVAENERCAGKRPDGRPCFRRAKFPTEDPRWCWNCDPSEEAAAKRKAASAYRHPKGTPEAEARDQAREEREKVRQDGTLDDIVERALTHAKKLEAIKPEKEDSLGAARIANAISGLYRQAIAGLRARGMVGDILPGRERAAPAIPGAEAPVPPATPQDPMSSLRDGLDS